MEIVITFVRWFLTVVFIFEMYKPPTTEKFRSSYDYIIIGGGTAGSVLASRLSEDSCVKVLLLEAGPEASIITEVPAFSYIASFDENNWNYVTVPQKNGALGYQNQQLVVPRGKGLGGSSLLSYMLYTRGNRRDYDTWDEEGASGWSWEDVLPYFLKFENNTDPEIGRNSYHSQKGNLTIQSLQYNSTLITTFANSATERGYKYGDVNGANQTGYAKIQGFTRNGRRCSLAKAYLIPAQDRPNLDIVNGALVTKILINSKYEAYGVQFEFDYEEHKVNATHEVIVSGGSINSPQILMLSGIGPSDHLKKLRIPVLADLPVGNNFHDHPGTVTINFQATKGEDLLKEILYNPYSLPEFNLNGTSALTSLASVEGLAFVNSNASDPKLNWPDLEILMLAQSVASDGGSVAGNVFSVPDEVYNQVFAPYEGMLTFSCWPIYLRPKSRGTIRLASDNTSERPLIDPNFFQIKEDLDRVMDGMKVCMDIVTNTKAFRDLGAKLFTTKYPGCENYTLYSDNYLRCLGRQYTFTPYNPVGSCKMGNQMDKTSVVDPELRVIGVKNLRVADGSIMPNAVSGNTIAAIVMIAEKASDMIKKDNPKRSKC